MREQVKNGDYRSEVQRREVANALMHTIFPLTFTIHIIQEIITLPSLKQGSYISGGFPWLFVVCFPWLSRILYAV